MTKQSIAKSQDNGVSNGLPRFARNDGKGRQPKQKIANSPSLAKGYAVGGG